jgi:hypothetical protein
MDAYPEIWVAHDHPEAPLAFGAWLCCCVPCARSLEAAARRDPLLPVVLKSGYDRPVLPAWEAVRLRFGGGFEAALTIEGDYLREVFIGKPGARSPLWRRSAPLPFPDEPIDFSPCARCAAR